jgi:hypothetical protein
MRAIKKEMLKKKNGKEREKGKGISFRFYNFMTTFAVAQNPASQDLEICKLFPLVIKLLIL